MSVYHQDFNRSMNHAIMQSGGAWYNNAGDFVKGVKRVNQFAKDNKIISKIKGATDALGLTTAIDAYTGGLYSKGADVAKQAGYGKRGGCKMQTGGKGKGKCGRPRKVGRPKKK